MLLKALLEPLSLRLARIDPENGALSYLPRPLAQH